MAKEKRFVDGNALLSDIMMLPHNGDMISSEEVEQAIKDATEEDVVEVVRCGKCESWVPDEDGQSKCGTCYKRGFKHGIRKHADGFCDGGMQRK